MPLRKRIGALMAMAMCVVAVGVHCGDQDSGCAGAQTAIENAMTTLCGQPPYAGSSFCAVCVNAHYFSTTGPSDCRCATLAFDEQSCAYPGDADVQQQVGAAIAWANSVCPSFTIGVSDAASDAVDANVSDGASEAGE